VRISMTRCLCVSIVEVAPDSLNGVTAMRPVLILGLLMALCASANAATVHHAKRHATAAARASFAMMPHGRRAVDQPEPVQVAPFINLDATEMAPAGR
jgi:hypothetical protein